VNKDGEDSADSWKGRGLYAFLHHGVLYAVSIFGRHMAGLP
jgi:hypothetical protein